MNGDNRHGPTDDRRLSPNTDMNAVTLFTFTGGQGLHFPGSGPASAAPLV
jgi:hypothetical protein